MKYTKPQITNTQTASFAILGGKNQINMVDSTLEHTTVGAYSADE
jgi:hypothetical protein